MSVEDKISIKLQEAKGEAKERVGGATGAHETGSEQARLGSPLTSPGSEVALLLREPAAPGTVISPRGPADPGAMTPLMGPADPGTVIPLMGPADPGTVIPLMGAGDLGTMIPLMGAGDLGTMIPLMGAGDLGTMIPLMGASDLGTMIPLMGPAGQSQNTDGSETRRVSVDASAQQRHRRHSS